jgi:hypothetical protein
MIVHAQLRVVERNNLFHIGQAIGTFADAHDSTLPAAEAFRAKDGKPGLSWRVALLPHLGHGELYEEFALDEPWDSTTNVRLLSRMPAVYRRPGQREGSGLTHYQVYVGPGTAFERSVRVKWTDITDGLDKTLLVVPAKVPVPWTKPDDLEYAADTPLPPFGEGVGMHATVPVLMADGSVTSFHSGTPEATIRAMITRNGREEFTPP